MHINGKKYEIENIAIKVIFSIFKITSNLKYQKKYYVHKELNSYSWLRYYLKKY